MKVVNLRPLNNKRYMVTLDSGENFALYKGELAGYNIREDDILPDSVYEVIMNEILPKRARLRGLNLLKSRPYTEWQLRNKYSEGGYPDKVTDSAIEYLKGLHLIDDAEYCRAYLTYQSSSKSRKRMIVDLQNKGVKKEVIYEALSAATEEGDMSDEEEVIIKLLEKRHYDKDNADFVSKQKMRQYLFGKGFGIDIINRLT